MFPVTSNNLTNILIDVQARTIGTTENPEGLPAEVDGDIQYEVLEGDATVVVTPGTNGKQALLVSNSPNQVNRIRMFADARIGTEVSLIEDVIIYTVTAAEAAGFGFVSTEQPK